jgi:hypothetical protein
MPIANGISTHHPGQSVPKEAATERIAETVNPIQGKKGHLGPVRY